MPDGGILGLRPGKRREVADQAKIDVGIRFKSTNRAYRTNQPCSEVGVIADVCSYIEKHGAWMKERGDRAGDVGFIAAEPHLTLNPVGEVDGKRNSTPQLYGSF